MSADPLAVQHGGNHYKAMGIQPIEFAVANHYDAAAFSTLKYLSRYERKHGREDLVKGRHFVEIRLRLLSCEPKLIIAPAINVISPTEYVNTNRMGKHETAILGNLHAWACKMTDLPDNVCADLIIQQIDHLIDFRYPQNKD